MNSNCQAYNDQAQPTDKPLAACPSVEAVRYAAVSFTRFGAPVIGFCPLAVCCRIDTSPMALMS